MSGLWEMFPAPDASLRGSPSEPLFIEPDRLGECQRVHFEFFEAGDCLAGLHIVLLLVFAVC